jgi:hypothetical protein
VRDTEMQQQLAFDEYARPAGEIIPAQRLRSVGRSGIQTHMRTTTLTFPELMLIAATRVMLGAGLALLISKRLTEEQRETAGAILTAVGALTTVPLALQTFGKSELKSLADEQPLSASGLRPGNPTEQSHAQMQGAMD